jgi:hypothetical protein
MRIITKLGPKTLVAALAAGLFVGWYLWFVLPPTPRVVIPNFYARRLAFSRDARYVAMAEGHHTSKREWNGELHVWDTREERMLFSRPYSETHPPTIDGGYSLEFTRDADKLVLFSWGKATYLSLPMGEASEPDALKAFGPTRLGEYGRLTTDAEGDIYVIIHDNDKKVTSVHELETGKKISLWKTQSAPELFAGGVIEFGDVRPCVREVPTGKLRQSWQEKPIDNLPATSLATKYYTATPDCRTLIVVESSRIRKITDGVETQYDLRADQFAAISPDGRYLATMIHQLQSYGWFDRMLTKLGLGRRDSMHVVYDLQNGVEVARIAGMADAHFSLDGQTLVMLTPESAEFYDMPLASPWGRIGLAALVSATGVFLIGQCMRYRSRKRVVNAKPDPPTAS